MMKIDYQNNPFDNDDEEISTTFGGGKKQLNSYLRVIATASDKKKVCFNFLFFSRC
jgi:hypothetical protein